jgi:hypothetical protein
MTKKLFLPESGTLTSALSEKFGIPEDELILYALNLLSHAKLIGAEYITFQDSNGSPLEKIMIGEDLSKNPNE